MRKVRFTLPTHTHTHTDTNGKLHTITDKYVVVKVLLGITYKCCIVIVGCVCC